MDDRALIVLSNCYRRCLKHPNICQSDVPPGHNWRQHHIPNWQDWSLIFHKPD